MLVRRLFNLVLATALILLPGAAAADPATPAIVRVRLVTSEGTIVLALDARRAPKTTANFMAYVDDGRLPQERAQPWLYPGRHSHRRAPQPSARGA
jgi:hypothetical protein